MTDGGPAGNVKDMNSSKSEALQGLLHSLGHGGSPDNRLSPKQLQKLSDKIEQILGDSPGGTQVQRNENGQLVNEDGLPIIDITEPIPNSVVEQSLHTFIQELDIPPLNRLSPAERERRRRERDRILDLLEEEERLQKLKEQKEEEDERRESVQRRKESAKLELQRLKAAKDLRKKMGKALVWNVSGPVKEEKEVVPTMQQEPSPPQKKVTFADDSASNNSGRDEADAQADVFLGSVIAGRLRSSNRAPSVSTAQAANCPVKMQVVERHPVSSTASPISTNVADSDDESLATEHSSSGKEDAELTEEEESDENESSDEEPVEGDLDWDSAQHQREIALEYLSKRHAIGSDVTKAMSAHSHGNNESGKLGLSDAGISDQRNGKPVLSRFRADRMAAVYDRSRTPLSTSLGPSVIPTTRYKSLQDALRVGKLENDQLVGGDSGESGSEDETKEVLEMLKNGQIQNAGPNLSYQTQNNAPSPMDATQQNSPGTTSGAPRPSRFKAKYGSRKSDSTSTAIPANGEAPPSKHVMSGVFEHKPLRPSHSFNVPLNKPTRRPPGETKPGERGSDLNPAAMIIESPSFPLTTDSSLDVSNVVISPSFLAPTKLSGLDQEPPKQNARPQRPPVVLSSAVVESSGRQDSVSLARDNLEQKTSRFMAERKR